MFRHRKMPTPRCAAKCSSRKRGVTGAFWNLIGIHFWACMGHNIFIVFLLPWAIDQGVSRTSAVAIFTVMQVFSMLARFFVPIMADRMGAKSMMVLCFSLQVFPACCCW